MEKLNRYLVRVRLETRLKIGGQLQVEVHYACVT